MPGKKYFFRCTSEEQRETWVQSLVVICRKTNKGSLSSSKSVSNRLGRGDGNSSSDDDDGGSSDTGSSDEEEQDRGDLTDSDAEPSGAAASASASASSATGTERKQSDDDGGGGGGGGRVSAAMAKRVRAALEPEGAAVLKAMMQKASKEGSSKMTGWKKRWVTVGGCSMAYFASAAVVRCSDSR